MSFQLGLRILSLAAEVDARERRQATRRQRFSVDPFRISEREFQKTYRLRKNDSAIDNKIINMYSEGEKERWFESTGKG